MSVALRLNERLKIKDLTVADNVEILMDSEINVAAVEVTRISVIATDAVEGEEEEEDAEAAAAAEGESPQETATE